MGIFVSPAVRAHLTFLQTSAHLLSFSPRPARAGRGTGRGEPPLPDPLLHKACGGEGDMPDDQKVRCAPTVSGVLKKPEK